MNHKQKFLKMVQFNIFFQKLSEERLEINPVMRVNE